MSAKQRAAEKTATPVSLRSQRMWTLAAVVVACAAVAIYAYIRTASPDIKLLVPEHGASWIRQNRPFNLLAWGPTQEVVFFRKQVTVPAGTMSADVTVRALRACMVYWDRQVVLAARPEEWKEPHTATLRDLTPGEHTFEVFVEDSYGPAAMLAYSDALNLRSGPGWEEHVLGEEWRPALLVEDVEPPALARPVDTPALALAKSLWWLGPLFLAVWGGLIWLTRNSEGPAWPSVWSASRCRWLVLAAWFVMSANNFLKLQPETGYDLPGHVDYIRFIAERGELPDAHDGWQMFQAPLFYALAAAVYRGLTLFVSVDTALLWLRWIPLLCGAAQIEICYRAGRLVFPARDDLQSMTIVLGSLLPMNVYMSQSLGNEPLCGLFTALILLWCWGALRQEEGALSPRRQWILGLLFGLDLLTKMTAFLLGPVIAVVLAAARFSRRDAERDGKAAPEAKSLGLGFARVFGAAVVVCGWYYFRNWLRFGKFLVGGWDAARGIVWWQDPGYRTPWQLVSFGRSLVHPIHAGFYSLADGFFASMWLDCNLSAWIERENRPPWNLTLLLAAAWPALVLSLAIGAGMLRGIWERDAALRRALQLAGACVFLHVAAFVLLWLEVPAYSQAKASYTLGLTPAYAVLCVAGFDLLPANRLVRAGVMSFVVCWSVMVYATYFVV
jgi:hypothetical protein